MKKKIVAVALSLLCIVMLFAACAKTEEAAPAAEKPEEAASEDIVEAADVEEDATDEDAEDAPEEDAGMYDLDGQDPVEIVFAIPNGASNIETVYIEQWIDLVEERSEGLISFDYTNGGALGSYAELVEGVEYGVYDMSTNDPGYLQEYVQESLVLTLPFIFDNYEHVDKVFLGDIGQWYKELVAERTNMEVLNYFYCGFRYICSEEPINSLEDCEGMLIRSPQIQVYNDLLGLMGFSYVNMAWTEAYTAMSTGVINAVEVPLQNIYESGFYDLGKNITATRHLLSINCVIANEEFWAGLPDVYQQLMTDALAEITELEHQAILDKEMGYITKLEDKGCTFNELDDAAKAQLMETFSEYWYDKVDGLGEDTINVLDEILELKE